MQLALSEHNIETGHRVVTKRSYIIYTFQGSMEKQKHPNNLNKDNG